MAGLLGGVLPWAYSQGDRLKRHVGGLLGDPLGTMAQTAGLLQDGHRENQRLNALAFADQKQPLKPTNLNALATLIDRAMAGPMGVAPVGMMAGVGAKTANKTALAQAEAMEKQGAKPETIWQQTGWGRGPEGKWRFEIDDSAAKFSEGAMQHNALFNAYPDLRQIPIRIDSALREGGEIAGRVGHEQVKVGTKNQTSSVLHELQHAVQDREGFSPGGSTSLPVVERKARELFQQNRPNFSGDPEQLLEMSRLWAYRNLPGEAEARLVQARMNLTPAERSAQFPWEPGYFQKATNSTLNGLLR